MYGKVYLYVVLRNEVLRVGREKERREVTRWTVSTTASMRSSLLCQKKSVTSMYDMKSIACEKSCLISA